MSRCMHLANALRSHCEVAFILDNDALYWVNVLSEKNYTYFFEKDFKEHEIHGVIFDGYDFKDEDYQKWRKLVKCFVYIDDFGISRPEIDIYISPSLQDGFKDQHQSIRYSGLKYALIDPKFYRSHVNIKKNVENILISFGAVDSNNMTEMAVLSLERVLQRTPSLRVSIMMTSQSKHLEKVKNRLNALPKNFNLLIDEFDMRSYLFQSDMVIGSGGVNLLERMAAGLPSITIKTADNQNNNISLINGNNLSFYLGEHGQFSQQQFIDALYCLIDNYSARQKMTNFCHQVMSNQAVENVTSVLLNI